jgi:two-component system LytT family response regulator
MRLRALIVDDEPISRRVIRQLAAAHPYLEIVGECQDGVAAARWLRRIPVDLVFLDIRMPGPSGLDVARTRDEGTVPYVIFVTAYDNFAVPAFEAEATDYLLKPVTQARFDRAMERVLRRSRQSRRAGDDGSPASYVEQVVVPGPRRDAVVRMDDVEYVAAADVYASLHTADGTHLLRSPLERLAQGLDPKRFARVHRSFIVRIDAIRAVEHRGTGWTAVLASGARVPISRRRRATVQTLLDSRRLPPVPTTTDAHRSPHQADRSRRRS